MYKVFYTGIICFVLDGDGYVAALADGRAVPNPRSPGSTIDEHAPYLIIITNDLGTVSPGWNGDTLDGAMYLPIDPGAKLFFEFAETPPALDAGQFEQNAYSWDKIDRRFRITKTPPNNSIVHTVIRHGSLRALRLPSPSEAVIIESTVQLPSGTTSFTVRCETGSQKRWVTLNDGAELVVANVSTKLIKHPGMRTDDDDHIFIQYVLDESGSAPDLNLKLPVKVLPNVVSRHPFINAGRDLNVHCSPIKYP